MHQIANQPVLSVSECHTLLNIHLGLLGQVVVEGEISEKSISGGKWLFVTLKDNLASLQLFGVVFQLSGVSQLDVGMQVEVVGHFRTHPRSGKLSLMISQIVPKGEGAAIQAYKRLESLLSSQGLFDQRHKRPLPKYVERVGLLTATNSQAYLDFVKVAAQRYQAVQIEHIPIKVQGSDAAASIIAALESNSHRTDLDVLVLTRGGGSIEDLMAFNDEQVVRSIFASNIPIVCAIGHEGNITLAELVSDLRASTPSNAAELVVFEQKQALEIISHLEHRAWNSLYFQVSSKQRRLNQLNQVMLTVLYSQVSSYETVSKRLELIEKTLTTELASMEHKARALETRLLTHLIRKLERLEAQLNLLKSNLSRADMHTILKRGFSLTTTMAGEVITDVNQLRIGERLIHQLNRGRIESQITKIMP